MKRSRSRPSSAGCGIAALFLAACGWASSEPQTGKPGAAAPKVPKALSEEQAQILRDRELLENLELLSNLEQMQLFEIFNGGGKAATPAVKVPGPKAGKKDEAGKNDKKKN